MNPDPATVLRDYLDWTKAVHGGGATLEMHRELVRAGRPYPTWEDADAALDALTAERAMLVEAYDACDEDRTGLLSGGEA